MHKGSLQWWDSSTEHQERLVSRQPVLSSSGEPARTIPKQTTFSSSISCFVLVLFQMLPKDWDTTRKWDWHFCFPFSPKIIPTNPGFRSLHDWKVSKLAFWRPILDFGNSGAALAAGGALNRVSMRLGRADSPSGSAAGIMALMSLDPAAAMSPICVVASHHWRMNKQTGACVYSDVLKLRMPVASI